MNTCVLRGRAFEAIVFVPVEDRDIGPKASPLDSRVSVVIGPVHHLVASSPSSQRKTPTYPDLAPTFFRA